MGFSEATEIQDIYDYVYNAIIAQEKEAIQNNPTVVEDALSWDDDYDPNEPITEDQIDAYLADLDIRISFPCGLN